MAGYAKIQLPPVNFTLPSEAMQINVVKILEDSDYQYAKYGPKARSEFKDVPADVCYDVLQDSEYRHKWDKHVLQTTQIGFLNPNNDICYFAVGAIPPIRSRDFVLLRSWLDLGEEKFILAHSVWHDKFPPTKAHIRGTCFLTVYFVRAMGKSCQVTYLTLADPRGKLPSWLINRLTKTIAPRLAKKLHKACLHYEHWQKKHFKGGRHKTWLMGPDMSGECRKIDLSQCVPPKEQLQEEEVDESGVQAAGNWEDADDDEEGDNKK